MQNRERKVTTAQDSQIELEILRLGRAALREIDKSNALLVFSEKLEEFKRLPEGQRSEVDKELTFLWRRVNKLFKGSYR